MYVWQGGGGGDTFSLSLMSLSEISGAGSGLAGKPAVWGKSNLVEC